MKRKSCFIGTEPIMGMGILSEKYAAPSVAVSDARNESFMREEYISSQTAEVIDFRDIINCSHRKTAAASSKLMHSRRKPRICELAVAAELTMPESHRVVTYGCEEEAGGEGDFSRWLQEFGVDVPAHLLIETSRRKNIDSVLQFVSACGAENAIDVLDTAATTHVAERASTHKGLFLGGVAKRDVTGRAGEHRSLLMSGNVKQFRPHLRAGSILWGDDFDLVRARNTITTREDHHKKAKIITKKRKSRRKCVKGTAKGSTSQKEEIIEVKVEVKRTRNRSKVASIYGSSERAAHEPFRPAPSALTELIADHLHLLDASRRDVPAYAADHGSGAKAVPRHDTQTVFCATARGILVSDSGDTSYISGGLSTDGGHPDSNDDDAATSLVADVYGRQKQALECALGRHFEGITDGALLMVLQHLLPLAQASIQSGDAEKHECAGEIGSVSKRRCRSSKNITNYIKSNSSNSSNNNGSGSGGSGKSIDNRGGSSSISSGGHRAVPSRDHRELRGMYATNDEEGGDSGFDEERSDDDGDDKGEDGDKGDDDVPVVRADWEHVLCAIQDHADDLCLKNLAVHKVHPDLPDVRLTPEVVTRTQQRLMCLFGGARPKELGKKSPRVVQRLRTGTLKMKPGQG